jgi:hypothetical protein
MHKILRIFLYIGLSFIVIGCIGWFAGFFANFGLIEKVISGNIEYPLGEIYAIAIDNQDNIYCALTFYSRIQKYNWQGKFIRGWHVDADGGVFRIKVEDDKYVHIGTARNDIHYIFNTDGVLLKKDIEGKFFADITNKCESQCRDVNGNIYKIEKHILFPNVSKTTPTGYKINLITTPLYLWFIMGPFPAWYICIIGIIMTGITGAFIKLLDKKKKKIIKQATDSQHQKSKRLKFIEQVNGFAVQIPAVRNWGLIIFLPIWLTGWTGGIIWVVRGLFETNNPLITVMRVILFIVFCFAELFFIYIWIWNITGKEIVKIDGNNLFVKLDILGMGIIKQYKTDKIYELHFKESSFSMSNSLPGMWAISGGNVVFTYDYSTKEFGIGLTEFEYNEIVKKFKRYLPETSFSNTTKILI